MVDYSWNVMTHCDAREGKWRGNWRMEWVASTLHTASEHGVCSITTADAHTTAASSRLKWRPCRFKWTRPFRRKTKSSFCSCAITFQLACTLLTFRKIFMFLSSGYKNVSDCSRQYSKQMAVFKESDWRRLVSELGVCLTIWRLTATLVVVPHR
jgi:hypothetical protein